MISFYIPLYNEAEILQSTVERLLGYIPDRCKSYEIILVSNGSTDTTAEIGNRLSNQYEQVKFFELSQKSVGAAFRKGVIESKGDSIITLDADLSSDLIFIDYALNLLQYSEMVVGSKSLGSQRRGPIRVLGSQFYILITQLLFGLTVTDYSMGCKAFKKANIEDVVDQIDNWTGYIFELVLYLKNQDAKIVQVGIDCEDTRRSHFNLLHEGLYRYMHLFKCWRAQKDPLSWLNRR
ncbi:MAG: glycosyltransferase family 2 protein [Deltaproteobacteria bacterium]|nr:glycosyltransferase family 2 protein [Deltaproteobacteria bacterium]